MEGPDAGIEALEVDPRRDILDTLEKVLKRPRCAAQDLGLALDARSDEPRQVGTRQPGKLQHHGIEFRIADHGVSYVAVGGVRIDLTRLGVALRVGRRAAARRHRRPGPSGGRRSSGNRPGGERPDRRSVPNLR